MQVYFWRALLPLEMRWRPPRGVLSALNAAFLVCSVSPHEPALLIQRDIPRMHVSGGSTCPVGAGHQLCPGLRNAGSLVGGSWRGLPTAGGSTWGLSLRGGVFDEQSESSWDAEHAHLHPDNVMLDPDALRELGAFTSEKFRSDEPGGQAKEEIFEWMRTVQEMERAKREKGEKKEYIDLSDVEADSEDYRYYDDESNPRRFEKGYGPSRQLDEKMLETRKTYRWSGPTARASPVPHCTHTNRPW